MSRDGRMSYSGSDAAACIIGRGFNSHPWKMLNIFKFLCLCRYIEYNKMYILIINCLVSITQALAYVYFGYLCI